QKIRLAEFIAGKSDDQEKQSQEDRWRRCIVTHQPNANECSADRTGDLHDRYNRTRTRIRYAHHREHGENSPIGMLEAQGLRTIQGEQSRQAELDSGPNSQVTKGVLERPQPVPSDFCSSVHTRIEPSTTRNGPRQAQMESEVPLETAD